MPPIKLALEATLALSPIAIVLGVSANAPVPKAIAFVEFLLTQTPEPPYNAFVVSACLTAI